MNKKRVVLVSFLLLLVVASSIIYFFNREKKEQAWTMPQPNIPIQTQKTGKLTFSLRNASYSNEKISLGIEVTGGGQAENDLGYEFYNKEKKFASSASGFIHKLDNQHEYVTVETAEVEGLPNILDLRLKILARNSPLEPHELNADFEIDLKKK